MGIVGVEGGVRPYDISQSWGAPLAEARLVGLKLTLGWV